MKEKVRITVRITSIGFRLHAGQDFQEHSCGTPIFPEALAAGAEPGVLRRARADSICLDIHDMFFRTMELQEHDQVPTIRRRTACCLKDVVVEDSVRRSDYRYLLAYHKDDLTRPRPKDLDMLLVSCDHEILPQGFGDQADLSTGADAVPASTMSSLSLELRVLPLRITIDQDTVEFLDSFAGQLGMPARQYTESLAVAAEAPQRESSDSSEGSGREDEGVKAAGPPAGIVVHSVRICPLLIAVDYRAKRFNYAALRSGNHVELLNVLPLLEGLEIALKPVSVARVTSPGEVGREICQAWWRDVDRAMILRAISGVTPIRSLANITGGITDLLREPIRCAGQDGSVARGVLRGFTSFFRHLTVETVNITEKVLSGGRQALESVGSIADEEDFVQRRSLRPPVLSSEEGVDWGVVEHGATPYQPATPGEGLDIALQSVSRGFRAGSQAVARSGLRGFPAFILRPAIGATDAMSYTIRGVRNFVDSRDREDAESKYKQARIL